MDDSSGLRVVAKILGRSLPDAVGLFESLGQAVSRMAAVQDRLEPDLDCATLGTK